MVLVKTFNGTLSACDRYICEYYGYLMAHYQPVIDLYENIKDI